MCTVCTLCTCVKDIPGSNIARRAVVLRLPYFLEVPSGKFNCVTSYQTMAEIRYDRTYGLVQEVANTGKSKTETKRNMGFYLPAVIKKKLRCVVEDFHFAPLTSCCQI